MDLRGNRLRSTALACLLVALGPAAASGETPRAENDGASAQDRRGAAYAHMMRSMFAAHRGEFRAAAGEIRRAIELQPESVEVHLQGATMMSAMGRRSEAEQLGKQALEIDPDSTEAMLFLAELASDRALGSRRDPGSRADALRIYEELDRRDSLDAEALTRLANLRMLDNDAEGAIVAARKLVELKPGDRNAAQMLYRLLAHAGRKGEALDELLRFIGTHPSKRDLIEDCEALARELGAWDRVALALEASEAVRARPTAAHALLGESLLLLGRIDDAILALETALEADSTDHAVRHRLALAYKEVGRLADAAVLARALAREFPDRPDVRIILAETLDRQRDVEGALEGYTATLQMVSGAGHEDAGPFRDEIRKRMALLYLRSDETAKARDSLRDVENREQWETNELEARVAIVAEDWADARQALRRLRGFDRAGEVALLDGEVLARTGKLAKAEQRFAEALAVLPARARAVIAGIYFDVDAAERGEELLREWARTEPGNAEAHFELGRFLYRMDRFDDSESALRTSLELEPANASALNFLGYGLAERQQRLDEALELIERAMQQNFWEGAYQDSLGWVYFQMGRYAEAREPLERAAREYPKDPIILEHLGDLYVRLDEPAMAVSAWMRALDAGPDEPETLRSKLAGQSAVIDAAGKDPATDRSEMAEPPM